jgi:hypothetical protein
MNSSNSVKEGLTAVPISLRGAFEYPRGIAHWRLWWFNGVHVARIAGEITSGAQARRATLMRCRRVTGWSTSR